MSHLPWHSKQLPPRGGGEGCYLIGEDGKRHSTSGAAVSRLGHGDKDVIAAIQRQAETPSPFAHTGFTSSPPRPSPICWSPMRPRGSTG
ncbi:MAG: hypothetical protein R3D80_05370 [Paracoccaceae bacterium]